MSVPPSGRRPSSTPPSKGSPSESQDTQKPFQMPGRKEQPQGQQEQQQKKKGLFDLTPDEAAVQTTQQGLKQDMPTPVVETGEAAITAATATTAVAQVTQVSQLIQKMVGTMQVGQVGGKDFASVDLKTTTDVPPAFAGSNLTISYQANNLTIHFDNFMTPQQQNNAINLVEQNKEQLQQMVAALSAKNIQVTELSIGSHIVAIPRVEGLPAPFQPITAAETERGRQRDQGDQGGGREREQGEPH